jgi:hypothetical protein
VRRAGWNVADQALSALTNVVLSFIVARNVDADGFGAFSVAFLVFSLLIGAERSLVGGPLSMRHSHEDRALQHLTVPRPRHLAGDGLVVSGSRSPAWPSGC